MLSEAQALRGGRRDLQLVVGVDRLDYTKGLERRLLAFERLLEREPALRTKVRLVQVAVPSRDTVEDYARYRRSVDELVGRINGAWGTVSHTPIHYLYRSVPQQTLGALYRGSDVMLVTPIRDGMNLVAKEFCAARHDGDGVLVLSEFAGAAGELKGALEVNPFDVDAIARALKHALTMPEEERRQRMHLMRERVFEADVHHWVRSFLDELAAEPAEDAPRNLPALLRGRALGAGGALPVRAGAGPAPRLRRDAGLAHRPPRAGLSHPRGEGDAGPAGLASALPRPRGERPAAPGARRLAGRSPRSDCTPSTACGVDLPDDPGGRRWSCPRAGRDRRSSCCASSRTGSRVHWWRRRRSGWRGTTAWRIPRRARSPHASSACSWPALFAKEGLEVLPGDKVVELRPSGVHKGLVVEELKSELSADAFVLAIGDDRTDEDLFAALPPGGVALRVGSRPTRRATLRMRDPAALRLLLERFAAE